MIWSMKETEQFSYKVEVAMSFWQSEFFTSFIYLGKKFRWN